MTNFVEILTSDKCFALATFTTMISYGMFWTVPGSLIYEIKTNINQGIQVFGYLMTVLRVGKTVGHVMAIKVCGKVKPTNYPDIHLVSMAIQCLGVFSMPFCSTWLLLAICWTIIGISLGVVETNNVFFNTALNRKSAPKYTNYYYFMFSTGAALTPPIVDGTKRVIRNPKLELFAVCGIVAGVNFVLNFFAAIILKLRRDRGMIIEETVENVEDKPSSFRAPIASNICLSLTACLFMVGRSIMELFLLPYALNSGANLSEQKSYFLVQVVFISSMIVRLAGVFISPWLTKIINTRLLITLNVGLVLGIICTAIFRDNSYSGMIATLLVYGIVFGAYQNTLLNWMTDRLALNPKNTMPFFFATCLGSSVTPTVVPHLIERPDGSINVDNFEIIMEVTFALTVVCCGLLMLAEQRAGNSVRESTVEVINLVPVVAKKRFNSFNSSKLSLSAVSGSGITEARCTSASNLSQNSSVAVDVPVLAVGDSKSAFSVLTRRQTMQTNNSVSSLGHYTPML